WVSNQIYWRGWSGYEPETAALFFRLAGRARVTIDVGAYVGYYTLLAAHANPKARVFAFEPLPAVFRRLESNVGRNRLSNVTCLPFAVGSKEELREFYHVPVELPTSSSLSFEFMKTAPSLAVSRVRVIVLDRFVTERGVEAVDLVKIDTESTEPDVLRGMGEILARHRPTIVCEVLAHRGAETSLEELLGPLGYNFYLLTPAGPALRDHVEGHPEWLNYLFTPLPPEAVSRL
ncbi:MAG: FkbM family methyltransferase, partial [Vicinamibacterales bacterium]